MITLIDGGLYQWDTGRVVLVEPDSGYSIHEVHFTTKKMDFAYVVKTYVENDAIYCAIPNILLQQQHSIICYEVRENNNGEESVSSMTLSVTTRNKPDDYVYTESELSTYQKLEERIQNLEDNFEDVKTATDNIHTHNNKTVLDGITDTKVSNWDTAEQNANTYTDEMNSKMAARIDALEEAVNDQTPSTHTHSITDIEEVESVTNRTLLGECTVSSSGSNYIDLQSVDFDSLTDESVVVTIGDKEYEGTCVFDTSVLGYAIDLGDYVIRDLMLDGAQIISPVPASGTIIKIETVETKMVIPERYLPVTSNVSDEHINELIDAKLGAIENGTY